MAADLCGSDLLDTNGIEIRQDTPQGKLLGAVGVRYYVSQIPKKVADLVLAQLRNGQLVVVMTEDEWKEANS